MTRGMFIAVVAVVVLVIFSFIWLYRRSRIKQEHAEVKLEMFQKAFDISEDAILVLSDDDRVLYANRALQKLLGLSDDFLRKSLAQMPKIKIKNEWVALSDFLQKMGRHHDERMQAFPQSSLIPDEGKQSIPVNLYVHRSSMGKPHIEWCNIISIHDLRKVLEKEKVTHRHKLTKLPNQLQAQEDLNKLFSKIHLHDKKLALILIDIDHFSQIRSMLGYEMAEKIVIQFAQYLEKIAKESSYYVYHTYSNNFLLCIPSIETEDEVLYFCRNIQKKLKTFYKVNRMHFHLTASMGISLYPDSGSTLTLLDHAFKALADAQKSGVGHIRVFKANDLEKTYDELTLFNAVHEALENNAFEVHYQPIVRTADEEVVSAEALIRWKHHEYGYVPPDLFIPMLEKSGYIIELGRFVLSEVLKQQKRWEMFKFKPVEVSINMSLLELESEGFVDNVAKQLEIHQVPGELIKFEITEGAAMQNEADTNQQLKKIGKTGCLYFS